MPLDAVSNCPGFTANVCVVLLLGKIATSFGSVYERFL
jgi:hypothetical protein